VEVSLPRVLITRVLGRLTRSAYWGPTAPLRYVEMPSPPLPGDRWVRVRNHLSGICGSDLHLAFADGDLRVVPAALPGNERAYLGHEVVGEVVEVGAAVRHLRVGQRVVLQQAFSNCLMREVEPPCPRCAAGDVNLCEGPRDVGHLPIGGGWGDEMVVHGSQLFPIPDSLTDEQAVLIEPAAVGVRSVLRRLPEAGDQALVIGCGTIGLMTLQALRVAAPDVEVTCLARYPFQGELAEALGAQRVVVGHASYEMMAEITGGSRYVGALGNETVVGGFDVVYDAVGRERTVHDALRWTRAGGAVVLVGIDYRPMKVDLTPVWYHEVDLIGTAWHGQEMWQGRRLSTFALVTEWLQRGDLQLERLITHRFPLSQYPRALQVSADKSHRAVKVLFDLRA